MENAFNDLVSVSKKKWQKELGMSRYDEHEMYKFEQDVCFFVSQQGYLRIFILYLNGKPVSVFSGFIHNNKLFGDVFAHDPEYRKYSVGNVVLGYCIEYCINEGLTELDLSRGNESYKYKWNGIEKKTIHLKIFSTRKSVLCSQIIDYLYEIAVNNKLINFLYHKLMRNYNHVFLFFKKMK